MSSLLGVTLKGSFPCEARCFAPMGETVWVGERNGSLSIRSSRTGDLLHAVDCGSKPLFCCAMKHIQDCMWIGGTDGRLCVFQGSKGEQLTELVYPEAEHPAEIHDLTTDGRFVFAATANCRVVQWSVSDRVFVKSHILEGYATAVDVANGVLFAGDSTGRVTAWDIATSERICISNDGAKPCTALMYEPTTNCLWVARSDGEITILSTSLNFIGSVKDARAKITTMMHVGGKVFGGGADKLMFVWHAQTRRLIGCTKDHSSFYFHIGKIYSLETARVWTLSNDKSMKIYDCDGYFAPVKGINTGSEEVLHAYNHAQKLRVANATLERKLAQELDKVVARDLEIDRFREQLQQGLLRIHSLEHLSELKEEAMVGHQSGRLKLLDDITALTKKNSDLSVSLNVCEKEKMTLKGDMARLQEDLSRVRGQLTERQTVLACTEAEKGVVIAELHRLCSSLEQRDKDLVAASQELHKARDQAMIKGSEVVAKEAQLQEMRERLSVTDVEKGALMAEIKTLVECKKRLEDTVILREHDNKNLQLHVAHAGGKHSNSQKEIDSMLQRHEQEKAETQKLHDSFVLCSHQLDLLKSERDALRQQLDFEKSQTHDARNNETKLRLQMDEIRRQLETEKNNVKMLQDQYTIFQFVINSRGELVQQIWNFYHKCLNTSRLVQQLDVALRDVDTSSVSGKDRISFKRDWKVQLIDASRNSVASVTEFQRAVEYIVSNYFSEYEKLHLGVSNSKFAPDTSRPTIVGDQLLSKLRDVTLEKQFLHNRQSKFALPEPHQPSMGAHHNGRSMTEQFYNSSSHGYPQNFSSSAL